MKIFKSKKEPVEHAKECKAHYTKAQEFFLEKKKYDEVYSRRPSITLNGFKFMVSDEGGFCAHQAVHLDRDSTIKLASMNNILPLCLELRQLRQESKVMKKLVLGICKLIGESIEVELEDEVTR